MGVGSSLAASSHEVKEGLVDNGKLTSQSIAQVGEDIHLAGIEVGHGAHDVADAMRESARVGEHVAEAHHGIGRAIPIAAVYIGGAGICASLWLGTARNTTLLKYSIAGSSLYFISSAVLLTKQWIDESNRHNIVDRRIASIATPSSTLLDRNNMNKNRNDVKNTTNTSSANTSSSSHQMHSHPFPIAK